MLLTRAPLYSPLRAFSLDLHVLGTPPAFVLSQDQTLQLYSWLFEPAFPEARLRSLGSLIRWHSPRRCAFQRCSLGESALKKLSWRVSAIHIYLGLLFGFQRPSRLSCFATFATVSSHCLPVSFQPAGLQLLFQSASAVNFRFCVPAGFFDFFGAVQ